MAGIFRNLARSDNQASRMRGLLRRRPPRSSGDDSEFSRRIRQTIGGIWFTIGFLLLLPLLVFIIFGTIILILKIISILGPLV